MLRGLSASWEHVLCACVCVRVRGVCVVCVQKEKKFLTPTGIGT